MNWVKLVSGRIYNSSKKQKWYFGLFSMIGMGVGSFSMIISLSIMNGFETHVSKQLRQFDGDMRILGNYDQNDILEIEGIKSTMAFVQRQGVIESDGEERMVILKAVEEEGMDSFFNFPIRGNTPSRGEALIGKDLAYRLGKDLNEEILVYSPIDQSFSFGLPQKLKLNISGIFSTNILDYDDRFVFMAMNDGLSLFKRKSGNDGIDLKIMPSSVIDQIKIDLKSKLGNEVKILSWADLNRSLVDAMNMERFGAMLILSLIFLVASLNLAASLTLISIQRMKEIGILRAMGAPPRSIYKIMIQLGIGRAGKGVLLGCFIGLLIIIAQNLFGIIKIPSDIYFIENLPMLISFLDIAIIIIVSFIFIFLFSFLSAKKIVTTDIKDAIQWQK